MKITDFNIDFYQQRSQTVLGFHGCDASIVDRILNSNTEHLLPSENVYDWLGDGIYFWQNDPLRAFEWACEKQKRSSTVKEPAVIGAVIDLGYCLDLCERTAIAYLQRSYDELKAAFEKEGYNITDRLKNTRPDSGGFNLVRPLDCAVILHLHKIMADKGVSFDTVYGYFQEGGDAFPGGGIREKSHIQICVRNTDCIKGYFLPRLQ